MKSLTALIMTTAVMLPAVAGAQIKTLPGETITKTATVTAVDYKSRTMSLKAQDGTLTTTTVPVEVKRFNEIKVGDTITAKYTENIILRLMKPGEPAVDSAAAGLAPNPGTRPSATATAQRSVTATVTAIDTATGSVTVKGPEQSHTVKVADREALKQLKVGDRIDVTWAAAVLLSADAPKK